MEVEETTLPVAEISDENNAKKGKILTLLFPSEAVPADGKESKKDKNKPPTKVVIRRLPPRLTKDSFLEEFSPLPPHDYFHFVRGDLSLGSNSFSRAYINFVNQSDIYVFKEKYDDCGLQDERGKTYHAVVEFAPFQRVPRRNTLKKKLSKAGTLESDPKYEEFLKKLEEYKNNATNISEYFHESETPSLKVKVTTTPLLEYLKQKKQKKNDLRNELRPRKRELEKERKRKEEEKRKIERDRRKEEKKNSRYDDRNKTLDDRMRKSDERLKENRKNELRGRSKEDKKDSKNTKNTDGDNQVDYKSDVVIPTDPAILEVVFRHPDKSNGKNKIQLTEENKLVKTMDNSWNTAKSEKKYSDFRTRLAEEKQRKTFQKRDFDSVKNSKGNREWYQGVPDEKGDNCSIGNCSEAREYGKKIETDQDMTKKHDSKLEPKEAKSKFRYSEQRNRDREYRSQKASDWKKDSFGSSPRSKNKTDSHSKDGGKDTDKANNRGDSRSISATKEDGETGSELLFKSRRRSLELEKKTVEEVRKRSRSFHDLTGKTVTDPRLQKKLNRSDSYKDGNAGNPEFETGHSDDGSRGNNEPEKADGDSKKDPRTERRIRNKDRPSIEIYRPGMGKFSKQRLEQKRDESNSSGLCGGQNSGRNNTRINKLSKKPSSRNDSMDHRSSIRVEKSEDSVKTNAISKSTSEVRTMTFSRSGSKEN